MKILITGTSRGIGRAAAIKFLSQNYQVFGIDEKIDTISGDKSILNTENYTHFTADISVKEQLPSID